MLPNPQKMENFIFCAVHSVNSYKENSHTSQSQLQNLNLEKKSYQVNSFRQTVTRI